MLHVRILVARTFVCICSYHIPNTSFQKESDGVGVGLGEEDTPKVMVNEGVFITGTSVVVISNEEEGEVVITLEKIGSARV